jgi:hypothetical protein
MESIIKWLEATISMLVARLDQSPISGKLHGKLELSPSLAFLRPNGCGTVVPDEMRVSSGWVAPMDATCPFILQ